MDNHVSPVTVCIIWGQWYWMHVYSILTAWRNMQCACCKMTFYCFFPMFLSAFAFINLSIDRFQPHTCISRSTIWLIWRLWAALRLQWYYIQNGLNRFQLLMNLMIFTLHQSYAVLLNIPLIFPRNFLKGMCGVLSASLLLVQLSKFEHFFAFSDC